MFKSEDLENKAMNSNFITIKNESNVTLHGLAPGKTVRVAADANGTPLDPNWRRRIRDAKIDNCVSVVLESKKTTSKKKEG